MSPSTDRKRAVRIAGCSGGFTDRSTAIMRMAGDPEVDVVMGKTPLKAGYGVLRADTNRRLAIRNDHDRTWQWESKAKTYEERQWHGEPRRPEEERNVR